MISERSLAFKSSSQFDKTFYCCNYLSTTPFDRKSVGRTTFRQHVMFIEADKITKPPPPPLDH